MRIKSNIEASLANFDSLLRIFPSNETVEIIFTDNLSRENCKLTIVELVLDHPNGSNNFYVSLVIDLVFFFIVSPVLISPIAFTGETTRYQE